MSIFNEFTLLDLWEYAFRAVLVLMVIFATFAAAKIIQHFFDRMEGSLGSDPQRFGYRIFSFDITRHKFLSHCLVGLVYFLGTLFALSLIPPLQTVAFSLLASSGVLALIVGFACQQTFSNIISGLLIEIFKTIEIGDLIKIPSKNVAGIVTDITLRNIVLVTTENNKVIIPNSIVGSEIIEKLSWNENRTFIDLYFDNTVDVNEVQKLIDDIINTVPGIVDKRTHEQKQKQGSLSELKLLELTLKGIHLQIWFWAASKQEGEKLKCILNKAIHQECRKRAIPLAHYRL